MLFRSDVPVLDVSEQMPSDYTSLTSWIRALILSLTDMFDEQSDADDQDATSSDSTSENADSLESTADSSTQDNDQTTNGSNDAPQPNPVK